MKNKSVKEIKEIVDNLNEDQYVEYIQLLNQDDRKSVQNIAKSLGKKLEKIKKEEERLEFINTFENEGYANGYLYIGGVDEAGRCTDGKEPDGREEKNSGEFERI